MRITDNMRSYMGDQRDQRSSLEHFKEIELKKPSDIIIKQIRDLISDGVFKPGDRLPSERSLTERLNIGRGYVRDAIQKLEFYGILKTIPQKGTFVASLGVNALEGLISNILKLEKDDFLSLMETRAILEVQAAKLAASRADNNGLKELEETHHRFREQVEAGNPGQDEDLLFHLKISELSNNSVLSSLISLISPDILRLSRDKDTCREERFLNAFQEHEAILQAILQRNPNLAEEAMQKHMEMTRDQLKKTQLS